MLPIFDGKPYEWFEFWELFEATVDRSSLSDVEKLAYLISCLRGKAKDVAAGYTRRGDNYQPLVTALRTQFGNKDALSRQLQLDLRTIRPPSHNGPDLLRFYNDASRIIHHMQIADIDPEQHQVLFTLEECLPEPTRILMYPEKQKCSRYSTADFRRILLNVAQMLMSVQPLQPTTSPSDQSSFGSNRNSESNNASRDKFKLKPNYPQYEYSTNRKDASVRYRQQRRTNSSLVFTGLSQGKDSHKNDSNQHSISTGRKRQQTPTTPCAFCNNLHWHRECPCYFTPEQRRSRAAELHLCFRCLKPDHQFKECSRNNKCQSCGGVHNTLLCLSKVHAPRKPMQIHAAAVEPIKESPEPSTALSAMATVTPNNEKAPVALLLWQTARVYNPLFPQSTKTAKVFIDQGSQGSFITERLAAALGLKHNQSSPLIIHGVGDMEGNHFKSEHVSIGIRLQDGTRHQFEAYTLPRVTTKFLHAHISLSDLPKLWENQSDELPVPLYEDEPDILIGCNFISTIGPRAIKRLRSNFTLYDSELGPLIGGAGMVNAKYRQTQFIRGSAILVGNAQLSVEQLWSLDTLGIDLPDESIEDDERALHAFKKSIRRLPNGRYSVSWPWKSAHPRLVTNYGLCVGRLQSLLRSLSRQPERLRLYDETIQHQLEAGIIERAPFSATGPLVHYIPHQPVWNEQKKKLRIVYDASASAPAGQALNDNLLRGPVFLPDLVGQLLRLRQACIALVADVEKAFLQIELNTTDRDVARFLWVDKPTEPIGPKNPIITYRFTRVFFGAVSSPFLLAATIKHHLQSANSLWASRIADNIYVDNVLLAANSELEAITAYREAKKMFADACMNLRDFRSNSTKVNAMLAPEDRYNNTQIKVLGVIWDTVKDTIKMKTRGPPSGPLSKRSLLQFIAQQFDPLGYLSPIILPFKILLQDITKEGSEWDEEVAEPHVQKWNYLKENWAMLSFELPRRLPSGPLQLHVFADASNRAYSSVAYAKGNDKIVLLYAKSRLCPLKGLTIPRLELLAVLISLRITKFLTQQLNLGDIPRTIWSDSKCALAWIRSPPTEKLPRFVQNRLNEIKKTTDVNYGYVTTETNPADLATRGATPRTLADEQRWWQGPSWLSNSEDNWPNIPSLPTYDIAKSEEPLQIAEKLSTQVATATLHPPTESFTFIDMDRFSSWTRLVGSTTMALRFLRKIHKSPPTWLENFSTQGPITAQDHFIARNCLLRQAQSNSLSTEDIIRWDLRKDETGLWRCGGRLSETVIPRSEQYPIFLPQNHRLTQLLILREHMSIFHGGAPATLSRLHQHFWIPHGRCAVRLVITNRCLQRRRWKAKPFALPPMPPLPAARVQPAPAFDCTGIDLLGPIRVSSENGASKRWIALFTCLITRAVHLEIAEDLSVLSLVECLRRFIARRGLPREIISDNGTNMVLTAKSLKDIPDACSVKWTFITAFAPWKGGVYERLVGLTKTCLRGR
uniref:Integrase catalytic domain-containing protein n=1 Tax=Ascaris lumbricoides TaxID=6252 RepID=A0A0M3HVD7_ASCLU